MTESISESLRHILAEVLDLDSVTEVGADASTETLHEWDSFAHVALITAVESAFDITIDVGDIERTLSLQGLVRLVSERQEGMASSGSGTVPEALEQALEQLWQAAPSRQDEVIYIHSRTDVMLRALKGDVGALLTRMRGPDGGRTLVFPAFPFSSKTYADYLARRPMFSVRNTPAMTGLLPATALKMAGCRRSAHPILSECAIGPKADFIVGRTHEAPSPFHANSTAARLLELDASMMGLGVDIATNALIHYVDDLVRDRLPFPLYAEDLAEFSIEHANGERETRIFLAYDREMTKRIKPRLIRPLFADRPDVLTEVVAAGMPLYRLRLRPFLEILLSAAHNALDSGDLPPWYPTP